MSYYTKFDGRLLIDPPLDRLEVLDIQDLLEKNYDKLGSIGDYLGGTPPDSYCGWIVSDLGTFVSWESEASSYYFIEWLNYLLEKFFVPKGHTLKGQIKFQGEEVGDSGIVEVIDGKAYAITPVNLKNAIWDAAVKWVNASTYLESITVYSCPITEEQAKKVHPKHAEAKSNRDQAEKDFRALLEKLGDG